MKKLKKFIALLLLLACLFFSMSLNSFAVAETGTNYDYLLSCGYPKDFLDNVSENYLAETVKMIGDYEIDDISRQEIYMNDSPDYIVVKTKLKDGENFLGMLVHVYWEWYKDELPIARKSDTLELSWNLDDFCQTSEFYQEDYSKKNIDDAWITGKIHTNPSRSIQGAIRTETKLAKFNKYLGGALVIKLYNTDGENANTNDLVYLSYNHLVAKFPVLIIYLVILILIVVIVFLIVSKKKNKKRKSS